MSTATATMSACPGSDGHQYTAASTAATTDAVDAECVAQGAQVDILGAPALGIEPVISIIVGEASTAVTAARTGDQPGTATPTVNPSLVTVRSILLPGGEVTVPIGQSIEIPIPEPIGPSVISAAAGTTGTDENGLTYATASAVTLDLLNGEALQGGIELELAACTSAAGVTPAALPQTPTEVPEELPKTGTDGPGTAALAASLGLGALGIALLRRTRTAA